MLDLNRLEIIFQHVFIHDIHPNDVQFEIQKPQPQRITELSRESQGGIKAVIFLRKSSLGLKLLPSLVTPGEKIILIDIRIWSGWDRRARKQVVVSHTLHCPNVAQKCAKRPLNAAIQSPKVKPRPYSIAGLLGFLVQIYSFIFS